MMRPLLFWTPLGKGPRDPPSADHPRNLHPFLARQVIKARSTPQYPVPAPMISRFDRPASGSFSPDGKHVRRRAERSPPCRCGRIIDNLQRAQSQGFDVDR